MTSPRYECLRPMAERLEDRIVRVPFSGCWVWIGCLFSDTDYGAIKVNYKQRLAHRVSWETFRGPIAGGMCVLHHCDVRQCINPAHLFIGTKGDNNRDCVAKDRHCRGERNARVILTAELVASIRKRRAAGESGSALARELGVSKSTIAAVKTRQNWKHLP